MIRRTTKTRKYHAPTAKVTQVAFENGFCADSMRLNIQVDEMDNVNKHTGNDAEQLYFEF